MGDSYSSGRAFGTILVATGVALGILGLVWMIANARAGLLETGGFVLGLAFLSVLVVPMVLAGLFLWRRAAVEDQDTADVQERRRQLQSDEVFRHLLRMESHHAGELLAAAASRAEAGARESLLQARTALAQLEDAASRPVMEAAWLESAPMDERDMRNVARCDDLLLAGLRRIRDAAAGGALDLSAARELVDLAHAAERQFALRQDLLLRGRSLPAVSPLRLLKGEQPDPAGTRPESLRPGAAVSLGPDDYLVVAHITYFAEGREWHALALRGEGGERRLQLEPGADTALFMEPVETGSPPGSTEESGTASVSVDGLEGGAEGIVVDYRRTRADGNLTGWWERWPEGERSYTSRRIGLSELKLWPAAVGPR